MHDKRVIDIIYTHTLRVEVVIHKVLQSIQSVSYNVLIQKQINKQNKLIRIICKIN